MIAKPARNTRIKVLTHSCAIVFIGNGNEEYAAAVTGECYEEVRKRVVELAKECGYKPRPWWKFWQAKEEFHHQLDFIERAEGFQIGVRNLDRAEVLVNRVVGPVGELIESFE